MDLDEDQEEEEEVTTPGLSEGGDSDNAGRYVHSLYEILLFVLLTLPVHRSGDDTPQATPRAQDTQEDEQTRRFFPKIHTPEAEEECAGTAAPLRIQRPNLKRYGKYIPMASAPFTPPEDNAGFEAYVQSPSCAADAFDIVSWKLQALTVAQPKLALTPPTPFNEHASWGSVTPTRRGTQSPKEEGCTGDDKRWRRALYFASDNGQVDSSAGLRALLQRMEELHS